MTVTPIAEDFSDIAQRLKTIEAEKKRVCLCLQAL